MAQQSIARALPTWFLRAALLASAATILMDLTNAAERAHTIVIWFVVLTGLLLVQGAWWAWHQLGRSA